MKIQDLIWGLHEKYGLKLNWVSIHRWENEKMTNAKPDIIQLYCLSKIFNKEMEYFIS